MTEVLNLLLRCYSNCSGIPQPWGGETEEEKSAGYPERALPLLRDMELIRDQTKAKETVVEADDKGEEE